MSHQWQYIRATMFNEEQVGPVSEAQFVEAVKSGVVKSRTRVLSPTRTKNQWVEAGHVPSVRNLLDKVADRKAQEKEAKQESKMFDKMHKLEKKQLEKDKKDLERQRAELDQQRRQLDQQSEFKQPASQQQPTQAPSMQQPPPGHYPPAAPIFNNQQNVVVVSQGRSDHRLNAGVAFLLTLSWALWECSIRQFREPSSWVAASS